MQNDGAGNGDALPLTAAELVWELARCGCFETNLFQRFCDSSLPFRTGHVRIEAQRLGHDLGDPHARIQGTPWVLENGLHGCAVAADCATYDGLPLEAYVACSRIFQKQHHARGCGLAASGLPNKRQRSLARDSEGYMIDCAHGPRSSRKDRTAGPREVLDKAAGLDERGFGHAGALAQQATL